MNSLFYPKLALRNIKNNSKFYFPYLLTCISTIAMFYIMCMISTNEGIAKMPGADALTTILMFGTIVVGLFSIIFLFYTNSFLMKRRKKELGLYNILGMEKRHIAKILLFETIITCIGTIWVGLILGILLSKLIFLILFKILRFSVPMGFSISGSSLIITGILFCGIFFATLLWNFIQIKTTKPIELLKANNIGEREPKSRWVLTIIGIFTTGAGYFIALTTESPLDAINLFFIAVILVIIGTYCLFTAGSIALLKLLRKNKSYYYDTKNFISVSGMIYRMKQNAVGLANICILSTMVLVMVSTTVSLYIGVEEQLSNRFPTDVEVSIYNPKGNEAEEILQIIKKTVADKNSIMRNFSDYGYLSFAAVEEGNTFITKGGDYASGGNISYLCFITGDEYTKLTGNQVSLLENAVMVYSHQDKIGDYFTIFDEEYHVTNHLDDFPIKGEFTAYLSNLYYVVVSDQTVLNHIYEEQLNAYGDRSKQLTHYIGFDTDGSKDEKIALVQEISSAIKNSEYKDVSYHIENKQQMESSFYSMYGGFLFLGLFLGMLFLMATVLIIYYKQISEGYEDKERFQIMKKVGMSHSEIKRSISSQILKVFFLPLIMAIIHIAAAFKLITKLLVLMNLTNVPLFMVCTAVTILSFGLIYGVVYAMTARMYYKIVS